MPDYVEGPTMSLEELQAFTRDLVRLGEQARERIAMYDAQQLIADASHYSATVKAEADAQARDRLATTEAQCSAMVEEAQGAVHQWYAQASGAVATFQAQCSADIAAAQQARARALTAWQEYTAAFDAERTQVEDVLTRPDGPDPIPAPPSLARPNFTIPASPSPLADLVVPLPLRRDSAPSAGVSAPSVSDTVPPASATGTGEPDWVFAPPLAPPAVADAASPGLPDPVLREAPLPALAPDRPARPATDEMTIPAFGVAAPEQPPITMNVPVPRLVENPLGRRHVGA